MRVYCDEESRSAPEGWVGVRSFADLRQLMLAQIVVEYSMCDARELVDFIASNFYEYNLVFWPRDGLTERIEDEERIEKLTRKILELTDNAGVELEINRNSSGHVHYVTGGRKDAQ